MRLHHRHHWNLTPQEAIALQKELAAEIVHDRPIDLDAVRLVAGVDVSVKNDSSQAAVVVVTYPDLEPVEIVRAQQPTPFPYIPGLLSFREGPVLVETFEKLEHEADVFIFDGMGRAHPRRIGIASHMGLWLEKPTIGCGKTRLVGRHDEPGVDKGDYSALIDKGEQIGVVLRTRTKVKPVFISVGHLLDLETAIEMTLCCTPKYRLPRPIRLAHNAAGAF
jgi:deoxyribonuclease V